MSPTGTCQADPPRPQQEAGPAGCHAHCGLEDTAARQRASALSLRERRRKLTEDRHAATSRKQVKLQPHLAQVGRSKAPEQGVAPSLHVVVTACSAGLTDAELSSRLGVVQQDRS